MTNEEVERWIMGHWWHMRAVPVTECVIASDALEELGRVAEANILREGPGLIEVSEFKDGRWRVVAHSGQELVTEPGVVRFFLTDEDGSVSDPAAQALLGQRGPGEQR